MKILCASAMLVCALSGRCTWAHPPDEHGHHAQHAADPSKLRLWNNSKTHESVRGSFLAARIVNGVVMVSIERENGDIVVFPFADLTAPDQKAAQSRIDEVKAINERLAAVALDQGSDPAKSKGKPASVDPSRPEQASPFEFFAPYVKTRWDDRWLYVESDGLPHAPWAYAPMVGIKSWQQQVPLPQAYTGDNAWRIPLKPELADHPISGKTALYRGAIALAANGVPIFNALNNRGDDTYKVGELDDFGGHSGRGDDYHYHIAPLAIQNIVGKDKPIAYALDGFPIYGLFDPKAKAGEDKSCPLRATEQLDELNGHFGASTKGPGADGVSTVAVPGLYHYHASLEYPYINGGVRGKVTVKDDQIDPQPRANPVRPWLQPLRGATVTGFQSLAQNSWSLAYTLLGKKHLVNFRREGAGPDARFIFDFISPDGSRTTETYSTHVPRDDRRSRGRPDDREDRRNAPPPPDAPRPSTDNGEPNTSGPASIAKPLVGFALSSTDVTDGRLAIDCTCDGKGRAPSLSWQGAPKSAKAFAVVMHHLPPDGGVHVYMIIANIPSTTARLDLQSTDTKTGTWGPNTVNRRSEYAPPCSKGPGDKLYTITLYALSAEASLPRDTPLTRDSLLTVIKDTTLATAMLDVKYARANAGGREGR